MTEIIVIVLIVVGLAALYGFLRLASWIADLVRDVISVDDTHRCNRTGDRTRDYLRGLRPDDGKPRPHGREHMNTLKPKAKNVGKMRGTTITDYWPDEYAEITPEFMEKMKSGAIKVHVSNPRRHNVQPKKNPRARTRTKS